MCFFFTISPTFVLPVYFPGYDRYIKLWDTERGECISRFTNKKVPYCVKFNPDEEKQHLFVAGLSDKKILCVSEAAESRGPIPLIVRWLR